MKIVLSKGHASSKVDNADLKLEQNENILRLLKIRTLTRKSNFLVLVLRKYYTLSFGKLDI